MFQPDWHPLLVSEREAMPENSGAEPFALVVREKIEFTEADVVVEPHDGHCSDVALIMHDLEERLLAKMGLMRLHLKRLVPSPAFHNVRPHRCSFGFKRIAKRLLALRQHRELNVG